MLTSLNLTGGGYAPQAGAWTGSGVAASSTAMTMNCSNWTSSSATLMSFFGGANTSIHLLVERRQLPASPRIQRHFTVLSADPPPPGRRAGERSMMIRGASVRACRCSGWCRCWRWVWPGPDGHDDAGGILGRVHRRHRCVRHRASSARRRTGNARRTRRKARRTRRKARRRPRLARRERRCSRGRRRHGPGHERRVRADQPYLRWRLRLAHRCRALRGELLPLLRADRWRGDVRWRQLWRFLSGRNEAVRGGVHSTRRGLQRRLFSGGCTCATISAFRTPMCVPAGLPARLARCRPAVRRPVTACRAARPALLDRSSVPAACIPMAQSCQGIC